MTLDDLLRILARKGYWITAWYPLSNGDFECRITCDGNSPGAARNPWGVNQHAIVALRQAMEKAELF
jgi:hypothetical protein